MIRNYVNHERVPVKLVGCGRGRDYAKGGFTHWAEDDVDIVKVAFPNIQIYIPNKPDDSLFRDFVESPEACYINLSR
jgi:transketolase C-terminal domain/subunit